MIDQRVNAALEAHQVNQNLELGNGNNNGNDNGNGNGNDNGNGNGNGNNRGDNGDGNENHNVNGRGNRWSEKIETCTNLVELSQETAYALSWGELMILMTEVYCPRNEIQKMETELDIHFVRDLVVVGQVRVLHVPSRYQFADIFTKGLPSALFE
ncbi:hypothetical protein Tco_0107343 [Tanacetum coccineum]